MKSLIYMDYMATTPVDPQVTQIMCRCLEQGGIFANAASHSHRYGYEAKECIHHASYQVASLVNADLREIIWTSGATESNNLAIKGAARFYQRKGKHIITMSTEHKSVLDTCRYLETQGFEVTYLDPEQDGLLDLTQLKRAIRPDTILVSIMHANNETGIIHNITDIGDIVHNAGALFHSDAAQSVGKIPIDLRKMPVDLMSFSAHKLYGPKGIGALFVSRSPRIRLEAQIHGGAHQHGLRSGTLPTHQIAGMGEAFNIAKKNFESDNDSIRQLRNRLWHSLSRLEGITLNGNLNQSISGCLNISIEGIESESLFFEMDKIAISNGSACNSVSPEPSHVLRAMGLSRELANCSIRISIGRFTTEEEVSNAIYHITSTVNRLRQRPSLWSIAQQKTLSVKKEEDIKERGVN